ncbi:MAG: hypothetical protein L0H79_03205 [Intrasporangium sp.]|nr:hypothetical protein [Intrasporangium sp.]
MAFMAASAILFAVLTSRWLGPSDRGIIVVTTTTSSLLMLLGSLGVGTGGRVLLARTPSLSIRLYLALAARLSAFHSSTACVLGLGILWLTKSLDDPAIGALFVPYAVLVLFSYLLRECHHGLGLHTVAVRGEIVTTSTQTAVVLAAATLDALNLRIVLGGMVLGQLVQVFMHLRTLKREFRVRDATSSVQIAEETGGSVVRFSRHAVPVIFGQAFVIRGDRLILGFMSSPAAVGIYGVAATFTELLWLVSNGVGQVAFKRSTETGQGRSSDRHRRTALVVTALGSGLLCAAAPWLVPFLLGDAFRGSISMIFVLGVAALPMASYQIDVAVLNGLGCMKRAGVITGSGSVALGGLCAVLVPLAGAMGAACASLVAYSLLAILARMEIKRTSMDEEAKRA